MKVDEIKLKVGSNQLVAAQSPSQRASLESHDTVSLSSKPSFTGNPIIKLGANLEETVANGLKQKNIIDKLKSFEWLRGENGGILITAVGTGLVAPIFIGFNPFVKAPKGASKDEKQEVKNTKLYTAMRQPISAVLAILFQLGALKYIDQFLNTCINNPDYSKYFSVRSDQSVLNNKKYLEGKVKKELKLEGKSRPSILRGFTEGFDNVKKQRADYDKALKSRVSARQAEQLEALTRSFQETGKIKVGARYLDNESMATLINQQIDEYVKQANKLTYDKERLRKYVDKSELLMENKEGLSELLKDAPKENPAFKEFIQGKLKAETNPGMKKLMQEILGCSDDIQVTHANRMLERIRKISEQCNNNYSRNNYLDKLALRNSKIEGITYELEKLKIADISKADDETIKETIKGIRKVCHFDGTNAELRAILRDTETFSTDSEKILQKIYKDLTKGYKKLVENNYKGFAQISKIIIGVCITLPITCNVLNWVYPRFMALVFPKLSASKKASGGDKNASK